MATKGMKIPFGWSLIVLKAFGVSVVPDADHHARHLSAK